MDHTVYLRKNSLNTDGQRNPIVAAPVSGRFNTWRHIVFYTLIGIWILLPLIQMNGHPLVHINLPERKFFLFGGSFNATHAPWLFFFLTGSVFSILFITALFGRVWCGWSCPQTVFLEGLYRKVDRMLASKQPSRMRVFLKWVIFVLISFGLGVGFVSYFVPLGSLFAHGTRHGVAWIWVTALTSAFAINFGWFREQLCLIVCPYGRMQGVLTDEDSLTVGYDLKRGEPRGKLGKAQGDCVDCGRCVAVCPTGIDIRNGAQLDCIACTACIDACDDIMDKINKPRGLVRVDSVAQLQGRKTKWVRPRTLVYTAFLLLGVFVFGFTLYKHRVLHVHMLRPQSLPYFLDASGNVINTYRLQLVSTSDQVMPVALELKTEKDLTCTLNPMNLVLSPHQNLDLSIVCAQPHRKASSWTLHVKDKLSGQTQDLTQQTMVPPL